MASAPPLTRRNLLHALTATASAALVSGCGSTQNARGTGGEGQRPRETVTPLAARLGITVNTRYAKGGEAALARECAARSGPTLISWQHEDIPAIVAAFGPVTPTPPTSWPDDRFDLVWVLAPRPGGWSFAQVPQLLLDGDSAEPIV